MRNEEEKLHIAVCEYIKLQYPKVIFFSDGSGLRLPIGLAVKFAKMKSDKSIPDLHMLEPRGRFHGFIMEVKTLSGNPYKVKGGLKKNEHTESQDKMLYRLSDKGYFATFGIGLDHCKQNIDTYLKLDKA